jgi:hypothetical protein
MNRLLSLAVVLGVILFAAGFFMLWSSDSAPVEASAHPVAPANGLNSTPSAVSGEALEKISPTEEFEIAASDDAPRRRTGPAKQSANSTPNALQRAGTPFQSSASNATLVNADAPPEIPDVTPAGIVGIAGGPGSATSEAASFPGVAGAAADSPMPLPLPLAFLDPSPGIKLDDRQVAAIDRLRQDFVDAVGGRGQDPNDPAYLPRWTRALPENDARLRFILGVEGYRQYMAQAMQEAGGPKGWFTQQLRAAQAQTQR